MRVKLKYDNKELPTELKVDKLEYEDGMVVCASEDRGWYAYYLCKDVTKDAYLRYLEEIDQKGFLDLSGHTFVYVDDKDNQDGGSEEERQESNEGNEFSTIIAIILVGAMLFFTKIAYDNLISVLNPNPNATIGILGILGVIVTIVITLVLALRKRKRLQRAAQTGEAGADRRE